MVCPSLAWLSQSPAPLAHTATNKYNSYMSVSNEMREKIKQRLTEIEREENVCILYAVESVSRAWGFESSDSDYDVRFIYVHYAEWYLKIFPERDVIELPINDIDDYSGWDLKKTFALLAKSNPVLFEWLHSPIVYCEDTVAMSKIREASEKYFSEKKAIYHYLNTARNSIRRYFSAEKQNVNLKKYLYVVRPLLACRWILENHCVPPVAFAEVVEILKDKKVRSAIDELIAQKMAGTELTEKPRFPVLDSYIENEMAAIASVLEQLPPEEKCDTQKLDDLFVELVRG